MKNPQPTTHNLQPRNKNGSILVFSLLILSVVTIASIGVATVTVVSRKAAGTTGKSAAAFQMADTGLERTLQGMYNMLTPDDTLTDLAGELGSECIRDSQDGGVIDVQTTTEEYTVTFHSQENPSIVNRLKCTDQLIKIISIKVVGRSGGVTRAIDVRPAGYLGRGLVGHWAFEDGAGTSAKDSSSSGNDGTLKNMEDSDWVNGKVGLALEFDGNDEYLDTPYEGIGGSTDRTITAWIKFNGSSVATGNSAVLGYGDSNGSGKKWHIRLNTDSVDGQVGAIRTEIGGGYMVGSTVISDGEWHFVTSIFSGTNATDIEHYIDGKLEIPSGSQLQTVNTDVVSGDPVTIGSRFGTSPRFFDGDIDDVRIYNRALSVTEICKLYELGDGVCQ